MADRDALVREVLHLLDEEEEGLGVFQDEVVAGEVAFLHELRRDRTLAGDFVNSTEEHEMSPELVLKLKVRAGEMMQMMMNMMVMMIQMQMMMQYLRPPALRSQQGKCLN